MSDLMREEFGAWYTEEYPSRSKTLKWEPEYKSYKQQMDSCMFSAWQASRECLVIELPKPAGLDRMSSEMSMQEIREDNRFNRALELAKKALTAAGVKYK